MYSKYNVYLNDYPQKSFTTIYNLLTSEMVCYANKNLFPEPSEAIVEKLLEKGICCKSMLDERAIALERFTETSYSNEELVLVLLLTGKCNCKCIYCYEEDIELDFSSFCKIDKILSFIADCVYQRSIKKVRVVFYGGEPLLNKNTITEVAIKLNEIYGDNFKFSIVTNGTLLKYDDVKNWVELGLEKIKVTIDGNKDSHDLRRPFKDGSGTYNLILSNLEEVSNLVKVIINVILDEDIAGVAEMIKEIKRREIKAIFSLSFRRPEISDYEKKKDLMVKYTSILKKENVDFQTNIKTHHGTICPVKRKNYYVIDGKGKIYGCEANLEQAICDIEHPTEKKNMY